MKKILFLASFVLVALFVTSCKDNASTKAVEKTVTDAKKTVVEKTKKMKIVKQTDLNAKEYTSAYVCPMHCVGSGMDKPGKCPACHMDLAENMNVGKKVEDHSGHDHSGHNH